MFLKQVLEYIIIKISSCKTKNYILVLLSASVTVVIICFIIFEHKLTYIDKPEKNISENNIIINKYNVEDFYNLIELEPTHTQRYLYQILNKNGEIVFEDEAIRWCPKFSLIDNSIMKVHTGAGLNVYSERYYDIENDKLSQIFVDPYQTYKNMVVYIDFDQKEHCSYLVVQDMFVPDKFYFYEKINFSDAVPSYSIKELVFLDEKTAIIEYKNIEDKLIKETLILKK